MPSIPRMSVLSLAAVLATSPSRADPPREAPAEAVVERFALPKSGVLLLVPVEIRGKTYPFALDTGCSGCVYDTSLASLLGEPIATQDVKTTDGVVRLPLYASPDAKLGSLSLKTGSPVITTDLKRFRDGLGEEVYGCVGMDFLSKHVFRVDSDRGEVVFLRGVAPAAGDRLAVALKNNVPFVEAKIPGLTAPELFMVDTGASSGGGSGLLRAETFDALLKLDKVKSIDTALGASISGKSVRRRGRLAEIELGGHRHAGLIFATSGGNCLGLNYWSRYVTTFDFQGGAIYLKKSARYGQPDAHDLSGLSVMRLAGRTTVVAVQADSAAAKAGIEPQDVIVKVNGTSADEMGLTGVRRLLAVKGTKVTMTVARGSQLREVSLALTE